jgi:hypothetical protein
MRRYVPILVAAVLVVGCYHDRRRMFVRRTSNGVSPAATTTTTSPDRPTPMMDGSERTN